MDNWLGRSLKHKLSLLIIISVLVPVLSLGLFSYSIAEKLTEEKAINSGMNTLTLLGAYLDNMVRDAEFLSLYILGHEDVQSYLRSPETDGQLQRKVAALLMTMAVSKSYIANAIVEPESNRPAIASKSVTESGWTDVTEEFPNYYNEYSKWWSSVHLQTTSSEGTRDVITMSRPIRSTTKYSTMGMLKISLLQSVISDHLKQAGLEGGGDVLLLDSSNRIMAGPDGFTKNELLETYYPGIKSFKSTSSWMEYGSGVDKKTILYYDMENVNWRIVGVIPAQAYKSQNQYFLTLTAVAVSIAMLFVIAFVLFLIQKVTKPLSTLAKFLKKSSPDEPLPTLPVTTIDEVGQLIISYNRMSSRIENLTDEVKKNESLKKEADMLALQAQINPHFLYNTLSSVHWMALMKGEGRIADMVGSLSDFLRFSLNSGQEYCTVNQEISHIDNYVNIQSIRYPDKFQYEADIPSELLEKRMLKLLLQPLIENAMIHGILKREGLGHISVRAMAEEEIMTFIVEDDGIGMPAERVEELRDRIASRLESEENIGTGGSYGLRNVHSRLMLHYGPEAGLQVESEQGRGTKVTFTIPTTSTLLEQEREKEHGKEREQSGYDRRDQGEERQA
ncbi:sensor histidine kinase [Paenibacillus sp. 1011MAR3C5]|uniref:cache domain-containing sensor histidine kinase n=1 Tax=Paenibacillus sp. 1011MAR3C5 TaxID=1675787 RepID=UPI000E6B8EA4|nr:sensor histidine kinase [Paenibacillus sp. 1011MAR3C5]RJE86169.1 sensor histidine kinase [Paenibacillus sp. 1011MAR3C5]